MGTWHPLAWISHAADWSLYGANAGGHHLTSLFLHALNALLLFAVLRRMTGRTWASAIVALVFAVHPLNVASVAWVSSRKGVLSALFLFLTVYAYVRYTERRSVAHYLVVMAAFAFGLLSKPVLVTLPVLLLLLDVWPLQRLAWNGRARGGAHPWLEKLPLLAMSAAVSCVVFAVRATGEPVHWTQRWAQVPISYLVYLKRIFWPIGLATPYPPSGAPALTAVLGALAILLAITVLTFRLRRSHPYLAVGWLWFLITLAPVIGFVQVGAYLMADRWMYLPMLGVLVAAVWGIDSWLPRTRSTAAAVAMVMVAVVLGLSGVTRAQIASWQNTETLFGRALAVTENNRTAHYNLAWYLAKEGRPEEAIAHYERAIEISPDHFPSRHNLALLLWSEERTEEAIEATCAALRVLDPSAEDIRSRLTERLGGASCAER
jgi:negative regulator of sigma E activity